MEKFNADMGILATLPLLNAVNKLKEFAIIKYCRVLICGSFLLNVQAVTPNLYVHFDRSYRTQFLGIIT